MEPYRQMAVFAAVVESGGFTAASRRLGIAKSALSRMVSELERRLGVSLLSRTTRRLSVTEPGAAYYEGCARMVAEASNATTALEGARAEPRGRLRVTIAAGLARHVLPALAKLASENPRLELDVRLGDRYANLLDEDLDLAIRGGALEDSTLIARQLTAVLYVLCAAPDYLKRHGVPTSAADLSDHEWIAHEQGPRQLSGRHRRRRFRVELRGRFRTDSGPAVVELLRAGAGISLTPLWEVIDDLRSGTLQVVLPDHEIKRSAVYCLSPAGRQRLPKVRAATEQLAALLAGSGWDRVDPRWVAAPGRRARRGG